MESRWRRARRKTLVDRRRVGGRVGGRVGRRVSGPVVLAVVIAARLEEVRAVVSAVASAVELAARLGAVRAAMWEAVRVAMLPVRATRTERRPNQSSAPAGASSADLLRRSTRRLQKPSIEAFNPNPPTESIRDLDLDSARRSDLRSDPRSDPRSDLRAELGFDLRFEGAVRLLRASDNRVEPVTGV